MTIATAEREDSVLLVEGGRRVAAEVVRAAGSAAASISWLMLTVIETSPRSLQQPGGTHDERRLRQLLKRFAEANVELMAADLQQIEEAQIVAESDRDQPAADDDRSVTRQTNTFPLRHHERGSA